MTERESDTYRRGLTLGLTIAEIFILILFLLLLVLLALYAFNAETEKKFHEVKEQIEQTRTELVETEKQLQDAKKTAMQLRTELIAIKNEIDSSRSPSPEEIKRLVLNNKSLQDDLNDAEAENTIATELLEKAKKQLAQTEQKSKEIAKNIEELVQENESLKKAKNQLRTELSSEKGIDPPCWYKVTTRGGERHESPYYLMDVAVYNEYLEIRGRKTPPGYAIDEGGQRATTSYQEEYEKLPLLLLLGKIKKVSLQQFAEITKPIKQMGKNNQIRDYACVFYVQVWDLTPTTAKARWKKAEDAIKESFYTYRVRKDPW